MKRLKTSLKGIIASFLFNLQDERFNALYPISTKGKAMSGCIFLARAINP